MNGFKKINELTIKIDGLNISISSKKIHNQLILANKNLQENKLDYSESVFRTNLAYEGCLRLSYNILTDIKVENPTLHQIEQELINKGIISQRFSGFLSIYRTKWRNDSSHNHKTSFTYDDAFLGLSMVKCIIEILLQKVSNHLEKKEKFRIEQLNLEKKANIQKFILDKNPNSIDLLSEIIKEFSYDNNGFDDAKTIKECKFLLLTFIDFLNIGITFEIDYVFKNEINTFEFDILFNYQKKETSYGN